MTEKTAEDIETLIDIFEINDFHYLNVLEKEQLIKIIQRWPLLAELEKSKKKVTSK